MLMAQPRRLPSGRVHHPAYTASAGQAMNFGTGTLAVGNPTVTPRRSPGTTVPRTS